MRPQHRRVRATISCSPQHARGDAPSTAPPLPPRCYPLAVLPPDEVLPLSLRSHRVGHRCDLPTGEECVGATPTPAPGPGRRHRPPGHPRERWRSHPRGLAAPPPPRVAVHRGRWASPALAPCFCSDRSCLTSAATSWRVTIRRSGRSSTPVGIPGVPFVHRLITGVWSAAFVGEFDIRVVGTPRDGGAAFPDHLGSYADHSKPGQRRQWTGELRGIV